MKDNCGKDTINRHVNVKSEVDQNIMISPRQGVPDEGGPPLLDFQIVMDILLWTVLRLETRTFTPP